LKLNNFFEKNFQSRERGMFFIFLKNLTKIKILNPMNRQTTLQQDPGV